VLDVIDATDVKTVARALEKPCKLLWLETPTNPMLRITTSRRREAGQAGRRAGRLRQHLRLALPAAAAPLGCDVVMHSATKYSAATATWSWVRWC